MVNGIIAVVLGYLLGSIPSAYIVTRLATGRDIRRMGGGNVGGLNVFREVGLGAAAATGFADLAKGAAAVAIAQWLLDASPHFVLATAVAAVVGHNWMLFLKFKGGKGMGAAIGGLFILVPLYGFPLGLAFFFAVILIPFVITRNVALSMGAGVLSLPFIGWLGVKTPPAGYHQLDFIIYTIVLGLVILVKFIPTARTALARAKTARSFIFDRGQGGIRGE
jgi:glycerol-3-phosphate acyltransferase PlsY